VPSLIGFRDRKHQPIWDTIIHPPLPCDAWIVVDLVAHPRSPLAPLGVITRSDFAGRYVPPDQDTLIWISIPHVYPTIGALEIKHADDVAGWSEVVSDGWLEIIEV
jgi:hypothetical protein